MTLEPGGSGDLLLLELLEGGDRMFKIVDVASAAAVGSVGFWTKEWRDEQAYEVGWMVVPEFQVRGIAVAATAQAIELAKCDRRASSSSRSGTS